MKRGNKACMFGILSVGSGLIRPSALQIGTAMSSTNITVYFGFDLVARILLMFTTVKPSSASTRQPKSFSKAGITFFLMYSPWEPPQMLMTISFRWARASRAKNVGAVIAPPAIARKRLRDGFKTLRDFVMLPPPRHLSLAAARLCARAEPAR